MTDAAITLYFSRGRQSLKVSFCEGYQRALRPYEIHRPAWDQIERTSAEIFAILQRANRTVGPAPEITAGLKKSGQILFDLLIPSQAKDKLAATSATVLTLHLEDNLVQLPWELLYDGRDFLCSRFAIGRIAGTPQAPTARSFRTLEAPFKVLIIADPRRDLPASYREGLDLRKFLDRQRDIFHVDFKSNPVDAAFVKRNLRDYDIVHYAGHAHYDAQNPSESGWLLSDGALKASEIAALGGFQPMPALLFCNACQSGRSDAWKSHDEIFGLANAFLLAGVQHYVGTFWEIVDEPGLGFAKYFYESIARGEAVGAALCSARRALIHAGGAGSLNWANYMLYGEPGATFDGGKTKNTPETESIGWKRILRGTLPPLQTEKVWRSPILLSFIGALSIALIYGGYAALSRPSDRGAIASSQLNAKSEHGTTAPAPPILAPLSMNMNMIAQKKEPDGSYSEVVVKEGSVLHSGDHFQVNVETNRPCHVYVLFFDSHGEASQLFPDPKIETPGFILAGGKIAVPDKNLWFWLDDHSGIETVYTLASVEPIPYIPDLLGKMAKFESAKRERVSGEIKHPVEIVERGVGGVTTGKTAGFSHSRGSELQRVKKATEVLSSTGAVVRAISFEHR
jgi:CHAT domain-containing protein